MSGVIASGVVQDEYMDRKRWAWALSPVWICMPLMGIGLAAATRVEAWNWLTLVVWYLVLPVLDYAIGSDANNPPESAVPRLEQESYYRILTYITVPIHYVIVITAAWYVATRPITAAGFVGLTLSVGLVSGLAINTGHELGHKKTSFERWLAKIVLAVVGYGHFFVEHNRGHHKDVATPEDPASARLGENIYVFALREVPGACRRSWRSEAERLARRGKSPWSVHNEVLQPLLITLPLYAVLIAVLGPAMLIFLPLQAAFGWWQLTTANFIEHYGLLRQKGADGRYERCRPEHSWNANHIVTNLILFHLQRHSDHHANPTRRYQSLRNFEGLPELPSGYPAMFALAYVPWAWRRVMDHRVIAWARGDLSKINMARQLSPARRAQYARMAAA
ncbi:MAG: alkane 1-monooxygenase [Deltaproteobacteria bacterium]|nr:MAG: alkane 1-monooxygenase [Deltaproteobacteria bacterium]